MALGELLRFFTYFCGIPAPPPRERKKPTSYIDTANVHLAEHLLNLLKNKIPHFVYTNIYFTILGKFVLNLNVGLSI